MLQVSSRLPHVGSTIFTEMSQLALLHQAINLGQGFPDYPMSSELIELVNRAMKDGSNQYAHSNGYPLLRERIGEKVKGLYGTEINAESEITVTPGGTYAIYTALTSVLMPGDEVIIFEPAFDSYLPNIELNGAIPVLVPLLYPDYSIPWDKVKELINPKTRLILINSPHNPTGSVLRPADLAALSAVVKDTRILILSDEVYEHLIYDGIRHESILRYPALLERSFVCFSFGKTYDCTGWKLGYCIAPEFLMKEFRKVHQFNCFSTFSPGQVALATHLQNKEAYLGLHSKLQAKRDYFKELLKNVPLKPLDSHGSYFQCYSYAGLSDESDVDFAIRLTKDIGVTAIPLSVFYKDRLDNKVIRFCFAKREETLEAAASRLKKL